MKKFDAFCILVFSKHFWKHFLIFFVYSHALNGNRSKFVWSIHFLNAQQSLHQNGSTLAKLSTNLRSVLLQENKIFNNSNSINSSNTEVYVQPIYYILLEVSRFTPVLRALWFTIHTIARQKKYHFPDDIKKVPCSVQVNSLLDIKSIMQE